MAFSFRPYLLTNKIQHYAWGERGQSAYIARLLGLQSVAADTPFAELWMGTHPLGTSRVDAEDGQISLAELVERYPAQVLGQRVAGKFGNRFPFLLKVLSAREPLSIQLHPSKGQAAVLHGRDAEHYPDDNHKPEIAIALDKLYALAGLEEPLLIERRVNSFTGLRDFLKFETIAGQANQAYARLAFLALLRNAVEKPDELASVIDALVEKFDREAKYNKRGKSSYQARLFLEMNEKYPGDVGLLAIFFLKLRVLRKGQAMYIPAGIPHVYLEGNIVECMASSDNVIRAGLTPKFKDIPALLEVANERQPVLYSPETPYYLYSPPVSEFRVGRHELPAGKSFTDRNDGVRILLVLRGRLRLVWQGGRLDVARGQSVLLPGGLREVGVECLETAELYTADVP